MLFNKCAGCPWGNAGQCFSTLEIGDDRDNRRSSW